MNQTLSTLLFSMIVDFFVFVSKLICGIVSGSNALIADSFYTFSNFITDILASIGTKLSKKRPNKTHPFGYGKVEYLASIVIGFTILIIAIVIFLLSFLETKRSYHLWIYLILGICIICKSFVSHHTLKIGKKHKSDILISTAHIASIDIVSTTCITVVMILSQLFPNTSIFLYIDKIISIFISYEILRLAYRMLKENMLAIIGEVDQNEALIKQIEKVVEEIPHVDLVQVQLIKYGSYYKASLKIALSPDITLKQLFRIEQKINRTIKKKKFGIKYTTIEIIEE